MTAGGGVGVLSAQEIADKHCPHGNYERSDVLDAISEALRQTSAAIAELIAADREFDEANSAFFNCQRGDLHAMGEAFDAARARRASALAALEGK